MSALLDSSALIALVLGERGADMVLPIAKGAAMSSVNLVEFLQRMAIEGVEIEAARNQVSRLEINVVDFTAPMAAQAAALREPTKHRGLSLGDRACLALAIHRNLPVFTSDGAWRGIDVGADIRMIR